MNVAEEIGAVIAEMRDKAVRLCNPPNFVDLSPIADWFDETADRLESIAKAAQGEAVAVVLVDKMVDRFLSWPLPKDFSPDGGVLFTPSSNPNLWPVGTNLFTSIQAREMFTHILVGSIQAIIPDEPLSPPADSAQGGWKQALIEELIVDCIYTAEHETNPKKALQDAIEWNVRVALDPAVSADARKLIADSAQGLVEALKARADAEYVMAMKIANQPEAKGWVAKVKSGKFGQAEMQAHIQMNKCFGAHESIYAALAAHKSEGKR